MNYRSLPTRLLILFAIISGFAFNTDSTSFSFSLSTERVFGPGDADIGIQFSSNGLAAATIRFRAYRVKDPVAFFMEQKDPHSPQMNGAKAPNTFDMIGLGMEKVQRDLRYAARDVMPERSRRALRDVTDLNGTKARKNDPKTTPPPANAKDLPKQAERFEVVAEWEVQIKPEDTDWHYQSITAPLREKGVYMIEGSIRGKKATTALIISEYGLVVKQSDAAVLAWVVNKRTGEKIPDVPITCLRGGTKIADDESDGDGLLNIELPPLPKVANAEDDEEEYDWYWEYRRRQLVVMGEKDGNFFIHDPYSYSDGGDSRFKVYLHTDRPIYRPAQSVFYRGIVRKIAKNGEYENYTATPVFIEIQDANDGAIRRDTLALSDLGTFNGQISLGDEIPLGYYTIKATVDDNDYWFNFSVEEYKKPEYKVVVSTDRKQYTRGDEITATVQADYFFGSPVANAEVEYFVYRSRYWRPWWKGSEWEYLYEEGGDYSTYRMEMIESDTGRLAPDGSFTFRYRTDDSSDADYVYRIQANVVDNSRRSISGAKSVEVTRGEFYLSLRTNKYVYRTGDEAPSPLRQQRSMATSQSPPTFG
ncbi:MAG: Large extracellular alpha-helical protein [Chlorobi bacterium OLB7]|nr:MAG: Large extracellular alpha-helical protein [Chlorobi bacterium OLB7]